MIAPMELVRLRKLGRRFEAGAGWALAALPLLIALGSAVSPATRPGAFYDVQVHLDLMAYIQARGVPLEDGGRMAGGMPAQPLQAFATLLSVGLSVWLVKSVLTVHLRSAASAIVGLLVVAALKAILLNGVPYKVADQHYFAIHAPEAHAPEEGALATMPTVPDQMPASDIYHAEINARLAARDATAARVRQTFDGAPDSLDPTAAAAFWYTAAQIAYLEQQPARVAANLARIDGRFHSTTDSDWRIRVMQHYAAFHGHPLAAGAYRPVTGVPFGVLFVLGDGLVFAGVLALALAVVLHELSRRTGKRLDRISALQDFLDRPSEVDRAVGLEPGQTRAAFGLAARASPA